jgi:HEPN domain-containing protein
MLDEETFERTVAHAMELWFEPEIRRRQADHGAPAPFPLRAAQVLLFSDGRPRVVRLNEEVQAVAKVKLKEGVREQKGPGDPLLASEIEELQLTGLPASEDPNCGHFTIVLLQDQWCGAFDFRYNRGDAARLLEVSGEFLATAVEALAAGRRRAAVDNLFSAAELAAKAYVIMMPLPGDRDIRSHGKVHSRFNMLSRNGNVDADHRRAFNALSDQRVRARYAGADFDVSVDQLARWKDDVSGLLEAMRRRTAVV